MKFNIITIFPDIFQSYFNESIIKRAQETLVRPDGSRKKLVNIKIHNLRDYTDDKRNTVDDHPYGGGPGMVMMVEPIFKAIKKLSRVAGSRSAGKNTKIILFSTRGKKFDQAMAKRFSKLDNLIMICGRYEGVDERVAKYIADEEVSIGDYVLTGGEIPAMIVVDAVSRLIPGVLGKHESLEEIKGSYPVYTRPHKFSPKRKFKRVNPETWRVPEVLLSGDHKKINEWRKGK
ncbi:MAG: tRNA (guanosine(37)-N1)-methyltransferase TrmD [Patescibacteria group bacterium]